MPITWITFLIGTLALIGTPFFSGFYSKDSIISAVHHSTIPGAGFAYYAVLLGVFITALYSFRLYFIVFHGKERMDEHTREHLHETPAVVWIPLVLLAIPSIFIGMVYVDNMVFGDYFGSAIFVLPQHDVLAEAGSHFHGSAVIDMVKHALLELPVYLAAFGALTAWYLYMKRPDIPAMLKERFALVYRILVDKYGFDRFNEIFFAGGARDMGNVLWKTGDVRLIDGLVVNGSARVVGLTSALMRHLQSGYLYHYAFAMIIGLLLLVWLYVI
jgi:NADH-quinone oxidoreductase subunit L